MGNENNPEDKNYRLEVFKTIGGILIPISIFFAGAWISNADKKAEALRLFQDKKIADDKLKQQEDADEQKAEAALMANLLKNFSSERSQERVIAVKYAETLIDNGQVSRVYLSIIELAKNDSNPDVAAAGKNASESIEQKINMNPTSNITKQLAILNKKSNLSVLSALKFRQQIYLHIFDEDQRGDAQKISSLLENSENNFLVPGIERVKNVPPTTEVRYTHKSDKNTAINIRDFLRSQNIDPVEDKYVEGFEDSNTVKAGTFEVWFGKKTFIEDN